MGKSSHHKLENTFRFQTFAERISSVNIDVIHKIRHHDDEIEKQSTYFGEALVQWTDLNCTEHFSNFCSEISGQVRTFTQLVHHEDNIVTALKTHLLIPKTLAYEPLLDLLVQLARDLQTDFYRHFQEFFEILVKLLNCNGHDTDVLEKLFSCLAYLFKFLWRYLVKDIKDVFGYFSSLLGGHYKDYIKNFAAESFAFLMRKVKNHSDLFDFLFSSLQTTPDKCRGVGRLLFEMMKGVKGQFHSISNKVFPIMLFKLGPWNPGGMKCTLPWQLVENALSSTMKSCAAYTTRDYAEHMWSILLQCLEKVNAASHNDTNEPCCVTEQICRLLRLTSLWLEHLNGAIVTDPKLVAKVLIEILNTTRQPALLGQSLLSAVSSLLIFSQERLPMDITARLVSLVYQKGFPVSVLSEFTKSLFDQPLFEKDVLPNLLTYIQSQLPSADSRSRDVILGLVTELIFNKVDHPSDGSQLKRLKLFMLDFGVSHRTRSHTEETFQHFLLSTLGTSIDKGLDDPCVLSLVWATLVCVPHVCPLDHDLAVTSVIKIWTVLKKMASSADCALKRNLLFTLDQAMLTLLLLDSDSEIHDWLPWIEVREILELNPDDFSVLRMTDLYLTRLSTKGRDKILTRECLEEILPFLEANIALWSHQVRLLSLHILSLFPFVLPDTETDSEQINVFDICLCAERVPLSVRDYRLRLMHLQKLDFHLVKCSMPIGNFQKIPLLYLIGSIFINFKPLWNPLRKLIGSHADGLDMEVFWKVYREQLVLAADRAEKGFKTLVMEKSADSSVNHESSGSENTAQIFEDNISSKLDVESRPDLIHFRLQLWRAMQEFPDKCEPKSKELSPLLFRFLSNEYFPSDLNTAPTQNISNCGISFEDQANGEHKDNDKSEQDIKPAKRRKGAAITLLVHLQLFSKFKNPKSLYMEPELRKVYFQFLEHKDAEVQKVAFECVMTYKHKYLMPYRENFLRILDDKTFKEEIVLFSLDQESSIIKDEHRTHLLPVLMGILYGRMQSKTGTDTAGKAKSHVRRSIVFRFLAGCKTEELQTFVNLVFKLFLHFVEDDPYTMVKKVRESVDLKNMIPLRRMKGVLNTITVFSKKLGHLVEGFHTSIFHMLLGLAATCVTCLEKREEIKTFAVTSLKAIRQLVITSIIEFFEDFEKYPFTASEINALFEVVVWPQVNKLSHEGIYSPTPLLKLLHTWTKNPRFLPLLAVHNGDNKELSPLPCVFNLLNGPNTSASVTNFIMEMVDKLLSQEDTDEEEMDTDQAPALTDIIPGTRPLEIKSGMEHNGSYGVCLVLPHVPSIMMYMQKFVQSMSLKSDKNQKCAAELRILAKISSYVNDEELCSKLCSLLLPFLDQKVRKSQEMEKNILHSIRNLISGLNNPAEFYRPVSSNFSTINHRQSRNFLCGILKAIGGKCGQFAVVSTLIEELNMWDKRRPEEPDYTVRLKAFQSVNQVIQEMEAIDIDFLFPVLHNCCYTLFQIDDLSLRDNSAHCLLLMVKKIGESTHKKKAFYALIVQGLLPQIKTGISNKSETVRNDFLTLLGSIIQNFPDHQLFEGLDQLRDVTDIEVDFFENIKHIQVHRRARAMKKLTKHLASHTIHQEMIISYFLPMTTFFILDPTYAKLSFLHDAAIDLLGMLCKVLPWHLYVAQLRHFLALLPKKLESQKLIVRVIVGILNAFHFDLSLSRHQISQAPAAVRDQEITVAKNDSKQESVMVPSDKLKPEEQALTNTEGVSEKKCRPGLATMIHANVVKILIPQLHKCITQKVRSDGEHKLTKSKYAEDYEILRVPLALAMVKLLQKLPRGALEQSLPGMLLKVCQFLKSRAVDIRETARSTLAEISCSLGPRYFPYILAEMRSVLKKGYQLHVLGFSVHHLLQNLVNVIKPGDLDPALRSLHEVFHDELFGNVSEEKDIHGITSKVFEAKTNKSYDSYEIVARFISQSSLASLIGKLKEVLETTHSKKKVRCVQDSLRKISLGLMGNTSVSIASMMIFVHGLTFDNVQFLEGAKKETSSTPEKTVDPRAKPVSCLLLQPECPRGGDKPKTSKKTNHHVLVEFGLQILYLCLRRFRLEPTKDHHLQLLDPLIEPLAECLYSKHVKINTLCLRCFCWIMKFPLPSLRKHITKIANGMFILLKNYASAGSAKGDNLELVFMCFKAVTVLLRDVEFHSIDSNQLQVLLTFCEEDLHDYSRQSTAFTLLKGILKRKLNVPELHDLMEKVQMQAITAESSPVRLQCRQVILQYLLDYPLGKKVETHLQYFVTQLSYELETGRESALEMLATAFTKFPQKILVKCAGMFFVPMSAALINDDSQRCRKLTALAIKSLLEKVDGDTRDMLFTVVLKWFQDEKLQHRTLAAQLCGLFVEVEGDKFKHRVKDILPLIDQQTNPSTYEKKTDDAASEHEQDHCLYSILNTLAKILQECSILGNTEWDKIMSEIWDHVKHHLVYPHAWVRLVAAQLFGLLFAARSPQDLVSQISPGTQSNDYLLMKTHKKLKSLTQSFCIQLQSPLLDEELANQIVRNMLFLAKVIVLLDKKTDKGGSSSDQVKSKQTIKKLSVKWLCWKMVKEANNEAIHTAKITIKRCSVFKWMAALSLDLETSVLSDMLSIIIVPLQREVSNTSEDTSSVSALKTLVQEVIDLLKKLVGVELFTQVYTDVQQTRAARKESRKRHRAVEAVSHPEVAAQKKLKKNLAKKEAKKRKIEEKHQYEKTQKNKIRRRAVVHD